MRQDRSRKRVNSHEHRLKIQHKPLITNIFIKANFLARLLLKYTRKVHDQRGRSGYEEEIFMSVIDFIAVRRRQGDTRSEAAPITSDILEGITRRSVAQIAADLGKSFGGKTGGTIGRAIVRGTLGGMMRR